VNPPPCDFFLAGSEFQETIKTMRNSGLAELRWGPYGVSLYCTDAKVLENILEGLKRFIPNYKVHTIESLSGETNFWQISELQGQDRKVGAWVLQQLCLHGWEPFDSSRGALVNPDGFVVFRRLEASDSQ
jgi:hypothetical protein